MKNLRVVVLGGGISGLTAAWQLTKKYPDAEIILLERNPSAGGTAQSQIIDGFTIDQGPSSFLVTAESLLTLARDLGLEDNIVHAAPAAKRRYIYAGESLEQAPMGPLSFLKSPMLTPAQKLRVFKEPFCSKPPKEDETVHAFASRHFGAGFADAFLAPMVRGITAGDAQKLSLRSLFPKLYAIELEHRSLILGGIAKMRAAKKARGDEPRPPKPPSRTMTFKGGIGTLCAALHERLGDRVRLGVGASAVEQIAENRWAVTTADDERIEADHVILATPSYVAAQLLEAAQPQLARFFAQIPYAHVQVTALGYRACDVHHPLDGFGFLVSPNSNANILGCLWPSSTFPGQAPEERVLLRVISGGVDHPELRDYSDEDLLALIRADLKRTMGISAAPVFVQQYQVPRAIPQYELGHADIIGKIDAELASLPGLHITNNAYRGVSLDDSIRSAMQTAAKV